MARHKIHDFFMCLPPKIRDKAIANTPFYRLMSMASTLKDALGCAFDFYETPEGYAYWEQVHFECGHYGIYNPKKKIEYFAGIQVQPWRYSDMDELPF